MCSACLNRQVNIVGWEGGVRTALLGALAAKLAFSLPALCCRGCARGRQAGGQEGRRAGGQAGRQGSSSPKGAASKSLCGAVPLGPARAAGTRDGRWAAGLRGEAGAEPPSAGGGGAERAEATVYSLG